MVVWRVLVDCSWWVNDESVLWEGWLVFFGGGGGIEDDVGLGVCFVGFVYWV